MIPHNFNKLSQNQSSMTDIIPAEELKEIETTIQTIAEFNLSSQEQLNEYIKHFSENLFAVGTAEDERYSSKDQLFDSIQQMMKGLQASQRIVQVEDYKIENLKMVNHVILFAFKINSNIEDQQFKNQDHLSSTARVTGLMVKEDSVWKVQQFHISSPDVKIAVGELMPSTQGIKQIINQWIEKFRINPIIKDETKQRQLQDYLIKAKELINQSV